MVDFKKVPILLVFMLIYIFIFLYFVPTPDKEMAAYKFFITTLTIVSISWIIFIVIQRIYRKKIKVICLRCLNKIDRNSFKLLFVFTFIWLVISMSLLLEDNIIKDSLKNILVHPKHLKLNEWGDFFAGFIAPLAFIWIGFGVYYQKKEFSNLVDAYNNQKKEFKKSVNVMEKQVVQIEIQKYHTWFDRNTTKITNILEEIQRTNSGKADTPQLINNDFMVITNESKYFNIFDEIRNILKIDKYVVSTLVSKDNSSDISETVKELKLEYDLLYSEHIKYCKAILLKVYLCISIHDKEIKSEKNYEHFEVYFDWLSDATKNAILNFIEESNDDLYHEKVNSAFNNISSKKEFLEGL